MLCLCLCLWGRSSSSSFEDEAKAAADSEAESSGTTASTEANVDDGEATPEALIASASDSIELFSFKRPLRTGTEKHNVTGIV